MRFGVELLRDARQTFLKLKNMEEKLRLGPTMKGDKGIPLNRENIIF